MKVEVILHPAEIAQLPSRDLRGAVCVVFDVLRATSTFLTALANGARRVYPVTTVAEARELQSHWPDALLGGERGGVRLAGFDLGNSPREYTVERVRGRDIISTTTNGTVALRACVGADAVYAGALLNVDALAAHLNGVGVVPRRLLLVCAGTGTEFALEDGFAAGALLARLRNGTPDDAGRAALALYEGKGAEAISVLRTSTNGRRLEELALGADVEFCAAVGSIDCVAMMRDLALIRFAPEPTPRG